MEPQLEAADEADGGGAQRPFRGFAPFGMRADVFYKQSESFEVAAPELHVTRAAVWRWHSNSREAPCRSLIRASSSLTARSSTTSTGSPLRATN